MRERIALFIAAATILTACPFAFAQETSSAIRQAWELYGDKEYAKAAALLEDICKRNPDLASAHSLLGDCYYRLNRHADARKAFSQAVAHGNITPEVLAAIARIDQSEGRTASLLSILRLMVILEPDDMQWQLLHADTLALAGARDEAENAYEEIIEKHPASPATLIHLANLYISEDDRARALPLLETAFSLGESSPQMLQTVAEIWFTLGDYHQSSYWYDLALESDRSAKENMRLRWAHILFLAGENERAVDAATPLARSTSEDTAGKALLLLGQISMKLDKTEEAVGYWERAVSAGYDSLQLYAFLGSHYFNSGDYGKSASYLAMHAASGALDDNLLYYLVLSLIRDGKEDQAREQLGNYIENYGMNEKAAALVKNLVASTNGNEKTSDNTPRE